MGAVGPFSSGYIYDHFGFPPVDSFWPETAGDTATAPVPIFTTEEQKRIDDHCAALQLDAIHTPPPSGLTYGIDQVKEGLGNGEYDNIFKQFNEETGLNLKFSNPAYEMDPVNYQNTNFDSYPNNTLLKGHGAIYNDCETRMKYQFQNLEGIFNIR